LYKGYIFEDMMCAYSSGQDACSGDSGAPLIRTGSSSAWDVVLAVVSWGNGCVKEHPGVYARISYQYPWIKDLVCAMSVNPPEYFECPSKNDGDNQLGATFPAPSPDPLIGMRPTTAPPANVGVPEGNVPVKVTIQLDLLSKDTGWLIVSGDGRVLAEVEAGSYSQPYGLIEQVVILPISSQFLFIVTDTQGDGICCEFGGGWFQVSVVMSDGSSKSLMKGYGTFALSTTTMFETPADNIPRPSLVPGE
jgi:Trypsin